MTRVRPSRRGLRLPLPPDLRRQMKKELAKINAARADQLGDIRREREQGIRIVKGTAARLVHELDVGHEKKRESIVASYEAKAAERRLAAKIANEGSPA